jgi:hypothetical protein
MRSEWDQPPVGMLMPEAMEQIMTISFIVAGAIIVVLALVAWRRTGSATYLLLVAGSVLCTMNEPWLNIPAKIWHARSDSFPLLVEFGRPMPLWVPFGYILFFGALPAILLMAVRRGATYQKVWISVLCFWLLNAVVELNLTGPGKMYTYYGHQPFAVGNWSPDQLVTNGTGIVGIVLVLHKAPHLFRGARSLLVAPLVPVAQIAALGVGIPGFWVINMDIAPVWQWIGMGTTLVFGVFVIDSMLRALIGLPQLSVSPRSAPHATDSENSALVA